MKSKELQQIVEMLLDDSTPTSSLRKLAEEHELNPNCRRKCDLCTEFGELEFEYTKRRGTGFAILPHYFFGDAIVGHVNCDRALYEDIQKWILKIAYGHWTRCFDQAAISNPNATPDQLLKVGKETVDGSELILVITHPNLTKEIENEILLTRQWTRWPKKSLLSINLCIDNEDEDFESIRIYPRSGISSEVEGEPIMSETSFEKKAFILGQLWVQFKGEEEFEDFFEYNDLGLPLAFALSEGMIKHTPELEQCINETWKLFIQGLDVEDTGFESLDDLLDDN
jgi:hypothetical protein